jgi:hypothetical protein
MKLSFLFNSENSLINSYLYNNALYASSPVITSRYFMLSYLYTTNKNGERFFLLF